ncbi:hypothetical protein MD484_g1500, partial [Candolleomyces efflorescens]
MALAPATTPPEIRVYASFPRTVALGPDKLNLDPGPESSNWRWVHCLTIPLVTLSALQFSKRPLKWIRYAIGVVIGAEGDLSFSPDSESHSPVDYQVGSLPSESMSLYYHVGGEERRLRMFPLGPTTTRRTSVTSSSSGVTTRRARFREEVGERDGYTCVVSGLPGFACDAVHLVPHSKGDKYISMYTRHRSRDTTGGDVIENINSVRNGLFLNKITHSSLGTRVAFLPTPNFAMSTTDIDSTAPPTEKRCTAHVFELGAQGLLGLTIPSGSPLRISETEATTSPECQWPPDVLFDLVYANAVLYHFGTPELTQELNSEGWKDILCPDGILTGADHNYDSDLGSRTCTSTDGRATGTRPDRLDMIMALPYILVPPDELRAVLREKEERAEEVERRRVRERVGDWMEGIVDDDSEPPPPTLSPPLTPSRENEEEDRGA